MPQASHLAMAVVSPYLQDPLPGAFPVVQPRRLPTPSFGKTASLTAHALALALDKLFSDHAVCRPYTGP